MLNPGTRVAHYEILEPIGKGGMGDVYRARDTKLGRDVAIKALPEEFSQDKDRLARFDREAKLLASVNHANIATLYGLEESNGQQFLAMELVEGETLEARIGQSALSIDEAVSLFLQIAEALEAAHDKGVIHRDLKPANIQITPDGKIKILDFGLAKALSAKDSAAAEASQSPTLTKGTALGTIMGTASYMSPEQARGKSVDHRTDIWAMGVCLFEALTRQKPFEGDTVTDTLAAVVNREPRWESLPPQTPAHIRRLLRRSLVKNSRDRIHHAGDARLELDATPEDIVPTTKPSRLPLLALTAVAVVATVLAIGSFIRSPRRAPTEILRTVIPIDAGLRLGDGTFGSAMNISPDGRYVAYIARTPGSLPAGLYLRPMDSLESDYIEDSTPASQPFFSPDSQWLGFASRNRLMKIAVTGGASIQIADIQGARGEAGGTMERSSTHETWPPVCGACRRTGVSRKLLRHPIGADGRRVTAIPRCSLGPRRCCSPSAPATS